MRDSDRRVRVSGTRISRRDAATLLASSAVGAALAPGLAHAGTQFAPRPAAPGMIRLGSNENPFGLGPKAIAAFEAFRPEVNRYPYGVNSQLVDRLSAIHGVSGDQILVTPGSGEVLRASTKAFTSAARSLVTAAPTFETPANAARSTGAPVHAVPVDASGALDLAAMAARSGGAGLFFVCNPNNPTGGVHAAAAVAAFVADVRRVNRDAVILVDEAYHEYVEAPGYATAVPLIAKDPRVIVSRTFSKVFGMAGLRLGYVLGQRETLDAIRRVSGQGMVSGLTAATGLAALDDEAHVTAQRTLNHEARAFTRQAFESAGYKVLPSDANFLMVDVRRDCRVFQSQCYEAGVQVARPFPPLTTHARISIGTPDEMRRAIAAILPILAAPASAEARRIAQSGVLAEWHAGVC
jgi:histidinol-phosphate aminotransferase